MRHAPYHKCLYCSTPPTATECAIYGSPRTGGSEVHLGHHNKKAGPRCGTPRASPRPPHAPGGDITARGVGVMAGRSVLCCRHPILYAFTFQKVDCTLSTGVLFTGLAEHVSPHTSHSAHLTAHNTHLTVQVLRCTSQCAQHISHPTHPCTLVNTLQS